MQRVKVGSYLLKKALLQVYDALGKNAGLYPVYDTPLQLWEGLGRPEQMELPGVGSVALYVEFNQLWCKPLTK